jgi:hypothetical protein
MSSIATTKLTLVKKLRNILRSLALVDDPSMWKSAYSKAQAIVTNGFPSIPSI